MAAFQHLNELFYPPSAESCTPLPSGVSHPPSHSQGSYHIFFITGNPGLIGYYEPFLSTLSQLLSQALGPRGPEFYIYGTSMKGFQVGPDTNGTAADPRDHFTKHSEHAPPCGLQEQIEFLEERLRSFVSQHQAISDAGKQQGRRKRPKVILMGHSVGAYVLLELVRRWRSRVRTGTSAYMDIVGGILLFPTVTDIAKSSSGVKITKLFLIPNFPKMMNTIVNILVMFLSHHILDSLVKLVMGSLPVHALHTTLAFLRSGRGIEQALHMAKDEMMSITEDRWDEEIWGAATTMIDNTRTNISGPGTTRNRSTGDRHSLRATDPSTSPPPPKLIFYFAEKDHWVAANTRDELIAARGTLHYDDDHGQEEKQQSPPNDSYTKDNQWSRPRMMIDKGGVPHGFCISHSELMAGKVSKWIIEMIRADLDEQEGNLTGNGNGSKISKDP